MDQGPGCPHGYLPPPQQLPYHHPPAFAAPSTTPQLQPPRIIPAQRFFNPWEPPPPPVPPPTDCDLQKRIDKLVECAAKNGPQFEQLMKERQKDNALYSFLFGAEGHGFYRYKLWLTINHHLAPINPAFALVNPNLASVNPPLAPSANGNGPMHGNCKKPPKYPGRSSSLDAATLAALKAAATRKKAMKQAAIRRRARVSDPANSGGTSLIALVLTLGFGVLMVFQGLFVQSNTTYGDSDETFVDIPSNQFGELSVEKSISYGQSYQVDPELHSSPEPVDPGKADIVISTALYKSMQEIQFSRSSQLSGRFAASG